MRTPEATGLSHLIEDLRQPAAYPHPVGEVEVIQTHISYVLLAGAFAYKIKKPVDFGFLDFHTLRRRLYFCQREVQLNERLAHGLYLGVVPITREGGVCRMGGTGAPVEYAVRMRRLPREGMMDAQLASGTIPPNRCGRSRVGWPRFIRSQRALRGRIAMAHPTKSPDCGPRTSARREARSGWLSPPINTACWRNT